MTKPIDRRPQTTDILKGCRELVCSAAASAETKAQAVTIAYEIGLSQGRVEGGKDMADHLIASITPKKPAAVPA